MKRLHIIFDRLPADLALVIALTLACILFVMVPPLNETPVRVLLGLLLVLFLPGHSLIAALFRERMIWTESSGLRSVSGEYRSRAAPWAGTQLHAVWGQAWCLCSPDCLCSRSCLLW